MADDLRLEIALQKTLQVAARLNETLSRAPPADHGSIADRIEHVRKDIAKVDAGLEQLTAAFQDAVKMLLERKITRHGEAAVLEAQLAGSLGSPPMPQPGPALASRLPAASVAAAPALSRAPAAALDAPRISPVVVPHSGLSLLEAMSENTPKPPKPDRKG